MLAELLKKLCTKTHKDLTDTRTQAILEYMNYVPAYKTTREIVVIDIENLAGTGDVTAHDVAEIKIELEGAVAGFGELQSIVACNHRAAPAVLFAFPTALRRVRSGRDGADLMLLEELGDSRVMSRFDKVTLCSGDGIFTDVVAELGRLGAEVTVIAREGKIAARLRLAAKHVVLLPLHHEDMAPALKVVS